MFRFYRLFSMVSCDIIIPLQRSYTVTEIAEHEDMGIRAIVFIDELSQITIGGYRSDGTGM